MDTKFKIYSQSSQKNIPHSHVKQIHELWIVIIFITQDLPKLIDPVPLKYGYLGQLIMTHKSWIIRNESLLIIRISKYGPCCFHKTWKRFPDMASNDTKPNKEIVDTKSPGCDSLVFRYQTFALAPQKL